MAVPLAKKASLSSFCFSRLDSSLIVSQTEKIWKQAVAAEFSFQFALRPLIVIRYVMNLDFPGRGKIGPKCSSSFRWLCFEQSLAPPLHSTHHIAVGDIPFNHVLRVIVWDFTNCSCISIRVWIFCRLSFFMWCNCIYYVLSHFQSTVVLRILSAMYKGKQFKKSKLYLRNFETAMVAKSTPWICQTTLCNKLIGQTSASGIKYATFQMDLKRREL